jgi:hypothetical protein
MRLGAAQSSKALVSCMTYKSLKTKTHGLRIRGGAASHFGLFEEFVIDVEGFLHTSILP